MTATYALGTVKPGIIVNGMFTHEDHGGCSHSGSVRQGRNWQLLIWKMLCNR
jgi:hypothetical protein